MFPNIANADKTVNPKKPKRQNEPNLNATSSNVPTNNTVIGGKDAHKMAISVK